MCWPVVLGPMSDVLPLPTEPAREQLVLVPQSFLTVSLCVNCHQNDQPGNCGGNFDSYVLRHHYSCRLCQSHQAIGDLGHCCVDRYQLVV